MKEIAKFPTKVFFHLLPQGYPLRLALVMVCLCLWTNDLWATKFHVLETEDVVILYETGLAPAAREVVDLYPKTRGDLERVFGWKFSQRPSILLLRERDHFQRMAQNPFVLAFAVPNKHLVVLDFSRVNTFPFSLPSTLKHEFCHLFLHSHLDNGNLPTWLEEGICQWVSDSLGEVLVNPERSYLNKAVLKGSIIPLSKLENSFPTDEESFPLSYEESKSFVAFMIRKFGKEGILQILEHMKNGERANVAIENALSVPVQKLERDWVRSLGRRITWFAHLSYHLYEILFFLGGLLTVCAFIRLIIKKRAYREEKDDLP